MTDPLAFLAAALDAAQRDAEAAGGDGTPVWSTGRHHAVRDENGEAVAYDEGRPTEAQAAHIARHDPASVLRRVAADRKLIDRCLAVLAEEDRLKEDVGGYLAEDAIRYLAEGWGWTAEEEGLRNG